MNVRKAKIEDAPALVALNDEVQARHAAAFPEKFRRDAPRKDVEAAFRNMLESTTACWFVAEDEGQPIAFLSAEFRERSESWCLVAHRACYLAGIVVASTHRKQGIARMLLEALQQEAAARAATSIELDVWSFNEEARQAFASLGFQTVMERMALPLEPSEGEEQ